MTLGETQDRFKSLWEKAKQGLTTPEETEWMLQVQQQYWENPESLGNLYR